MAREDLNDVDPHLTELAEGVTPFVKLTDTDPEYSLMVLGVREFIDPLDSTGEPNVKTFFGVTGDVNSIAEGIFGELMEQIENGNMNLFAVLRQVIRDIEGIIEMSPDDEINLEPEFVTSGTIH
jgi:hypothetical protein